MIYVIGERAVDFLRFKQRNSVAPSFLRDVMGGDAALAAVRTAIHSGESRWACFVSADVFLPDGFADRLVKLVAELDQDWPNWGCAAACARTSFHGGYLGQNFIRYSAKPGAFPNRGRAALSAMLLEGDILLLNTGALHEAGASIPGLGGAAGLDMILSVATLAAGKGLVVTPGLAVWQPHPSPSAGAKLDDAVIDYLAGQLANRSISTSRGMLELENPDRRRYPVKGLDLLIDSLRNGCLGRPQRKVAIVTRTRFNRIDLLRRTTATIRAFIAAAGESTLFEHHIVSDRPIPPSMQAHENVHSVEIEHGRDSRFLLVSHAAKTIDADFYWFVDDDDWLFPNEAERLSLVLNCLPVNALVIVDCEQFNERPLPGMREEVVAQYISTPKLRMPSERFFSALSGLNQTPFCGAIFPRQALLTVPGELVGRVTYLEDYTIILSTLLGNHPVFQCHALMAGISIRETGNTVTEIDRTTWDQNMARLISHLVNGTPATDLISLTDVSRSMAVMASHDGAYAEQYNAIINSTSWKLTRPLRVMSRVMKGELSLREFIIRTRQALGK